ncbi:hypothetical protein [Flavobacterium sp. 1355]|uniref:hypothetical protein n=1 Tax=Flavobacterium sp. 1355 TaxID=2806571 RepID=UPI001AE7CC82|nr:hypothetical protein [Flavobacterium sp. 1355]MBP1223632.1 hypothetical protein [Flavobacterium sp. 1355]
MKKLILLIILMTFLSCQKKSSKIIKGDVFINETGLYYSKSINIVLKEYNDGSLTYGVADKDNKLIYQQSVFMSFGKNQDWLIYVDNQENIWFYSSDIQTANVLMRDSLNNYKLKNFCKENIKLPEKLLKELSNSSKDFCFTKFDSVSD